MKINPKLFRFVSAFLLFALATAANAQAVMEGGYWNPQLLPQQLPANATPIYPSPTYHPSATVPGPSAVLPLQSAVSPSAASGALSSPALQPSPSVPLPMPATRAQTSSTMLPRQPHAPQSSASKSQQNPQLKTPTAETPIPSTAPAPT